MHFHLDREIRLAPDGENTSLYKWSLQEFSKEGSQHGSDQIPWWWNLYFTASELRYSKEIRLSQSGEIDGEAKPQKPAEESEYISATLHPGICRNGEWLDRDTTFSMFGTNRKIGDFSLAIYRLDETDSNERCDVWGCVSYTTEIDFRDETSDDTIIINLALSPKKFDDLRDIARNQRAEIVELRLGRVSGFYSEWSPSISTDRVKVLASGDEQSVVLPAGCEITPPRLGAVGEFSLTVFRSTRLNLKRDIRPVDIGKVFAEEGDEPDSTPIAETVHGKTDGNGVMLAQLNRAEHAIRRLHTPLWILVVLLVFLLLK